MSDPGYRLTAEQKAEALASADRLRVNLQRKENPDAPTAGADLRERMVACLVAGHTRPRLAAAIVDALLAGPLLAQAAEVTRLRAECERLDAEVRRLWAQRNPRAQDGEGDR